ERSLWRKFKEFILTYKMERMLSKNKILEIYLNIVELGEGIYGIKQGSFHYFKKHPRTLSAREGAFLAMLLPSPVKYSQSFKRKKLSLFAATQIQKILSKLQRAHILDEEEVQIAQQERF